MACLHRVETAVSAEREPPSALAAEITPSPPPPAAAVPADAPPPQEAQVHSTVAVREPAPEPEPEPAPESEPEPEPEREPEPTVDPVLEALRFTSQTQEDYESLRKLEGGDDAAGDLDAGRAQGEGDGALSVKPPASSTRTAASTRREYHFPRPVENLHQGLPAHDVTLPSYLLNGGAAAVATRPQHSIAAEPASAQIDLSSMHTVKAAGAQSFTNPISASHASLGGVSGGEDKLLPKRPSSRPPGSSFALGSSTATNGPIQLAGGSTAVSTSIAVPTSNKPQPAVIDLRDGKRPSFDHNSVTDGRLNNQHSEEFEEIQL